MGQSGPSFRSASEPIEVPLPSTRQRRDSSGAPPEWILHLRKTRIAPRDGLLARCTPTWQTTSIPVGRRSLNGIRTRISLKISNRCLLLFRWTALTHRRPKSEYRNPKQIPISKYPMFETGLVPFDNPLGTRRACLRHSRFCHSRFVSDFDIRISDFVGCSWWVSRSSTNEMFA